MKRTGIPLLLAATALFFFLAAHGAFARGSWEDEFTYVCSQTQDAMALSSEALRELIARCDTLKPAIEGLSGTQRKIYLKRLQACEDVYTFVLSSRNKQ